MGPDRSEASLGLYCAIYVERDSQKGSSSKGGTKLKKIGSEARAISRSFSGTESIFNYSSRSSPTGEIKHANWTRWESRNDRGGIFAILVFDLGTVAPDAAEAIEYAFNRSKRWEPRSIISEKRMRKA
jgi:hypothetical protein